MEIEVEMSDVLKGLDLKSTAIEQGVKNGVEKAALYLEAKMVEKINSNIEPALKPETIKWKLSHSGHGGSLALVATTQMLQQITHETDGLETRVGVIGPRAEIAVHHEFGAPAVPIPERSFIRSTYNAEKGTVEQIIADEIKKAIQT